MAVEPDERQITELTELAGSDRDGPLVMLNLNRYRDKEAYLRYGVVALQALERVGGKVLWHTDAKATVVGGDDEIYDEIIAVWYPSAAAFLQLATDREILSVRADRIAGLERAALIRCDAVAEPVLTAEPLAVA